MINVIKEWIIFCQLIQIGCNGGGKLGRFQYVLAQYLLVHEKAINYGFYLVGDSYQLKKGLKNADFYLEVIIENEMLNVCVKELPDETVYLPFSIETSEGKLVSEIRCEVDQIITDIMDYCFVTIDFRNQLFEFIKEYFDVLPQTPWDKHPDYFTFKTKTNNKWFAIIMSVPYKKIGVEQLGDVNILNIKINPNSLSTLIDNQHYFPAYHMNKKHWVSIVLDRTLELERIKELIKISYSLVAS